MGSSPEKNCRAASAFMITTDGAVSVSRSEKKRPLSSEEPTVRKKSGLIQQPSVAGAWLGSLGRSLNTMVAAFTRVGGMQSDTAAAVAPGTRATPLSTLFQNG